MLRIVQPYVAYGWVELNWFDVGGKQCSLLQLSPAFFEGDFFVSFCQTSSYSIKCHVLLSTLKAIKITVYHPLFETLSSVLLLWWLRYFSKATINMLRIVQPYVAYGWVEWIDLMLGEDSVPCCNCHLLSLKVIFFVSFCQTSSNSIKCHVLLSTLKAIKITVYHPLFETLSSVLLLWWLRYFSKGQLFKSLLDMCSTIRFEGVFPLGLLH